MIKNLFFFYKIYFRVIRNISFVPKRGNSTERLNFELSKSSFESYPVEMRPIASANLPRPLVYAYCFTVHHREVRETPCADVSCKGKGEGRRGEGDGKRRQDRSRRGARDESVEANIARTHARCVPRSLRLLATPAGWPQSSATFCPRYDSVWTCRVSILLDHIEAPAPVTSRHAPTVERGSRAKTTPLDRTAGER